MLLVLWCLYFFSAGDFSASTQLVSLLAFLFAFSFQRMTFFLPSPILHHQLGLDGTIVLHHYWSLLAPDHLFLFCYNPELYFQGMLVSCNRNGWNLFERDHVDRVWFIVLIEGNCFVLPRLIYIFLDDKAVIQGM